MWLFISLLFYFGGIIEDLQGHITNGLLATIVASLMVVLSYLERLANDSKN